MGLRPCWRLLGQFAFCLPASLVLNGWPRHGPPCCCYDAALVQAKSAYQEEEEKERNEGFLVFRMPEKDQTDLKNVFGCRSCRGGGRERVCTYQECFFFLSLFFSWRLFVLLTNGSLFSFFCLLFLPFLLASQRSSLLLNVFFLSCRVERYRRFSIGRERDECGKELSFCSSGHS